MFFDLVDRIINGQLSQEQLQDLENILKKEITDSDEDI